MVVLTLINCLYLFVTSIFHCAVTFCKFLVYPVFMSTNGVARNFEWGGSKWTGCFFIISLCPLFLLLSVVAFRRRSFITHPLVLIHRFPRREHGQVQNSSVRRYSNTNSADVDATRRREELSQSLSPSPHRQLSRRQQLQIRCSGEMEAQWADHLELLADLSARSSRQPEHLCAGKCTRL